MGDVANFLLAMGEFQQAKVWPSEEGSQPKHLVLAREIQKVKHRAFVEVGWPQVFDDQRAGR